MGVESATFDGVFRIGFGRKFKDVIQPCIAYRFSRTVEYVKVITEVEVIFDPANSALF